MDSCFKKIIMVVLKNPLLDTGPCFPAVVTQVVSSVSTLVRLRRAAAPRVPRHEACGCRAAPAAARKFCHFVSIFSDKFALWVVCDLHNKVDLYIHVLLWAWMHIVRQADAPTQKKPRTSDMLHWGHRFSTRHPFQTTDNKQPPHNHNARFTPTATARATQSWHHLQATAASHRVSFGLDECLTRL